MEMKGGLGRGAPAGDDASPMLVVVIILVGVVSWVMGGLSGGKL